jgi:leucyl-tRNA synthetase
MSKHLGNVVEPDELVERYGADTVRLAVLYAARPQRSLNWDDSAVLRANRYLGQVWELTVARAALARAEGDPPLPAADELPDPEQEQARDGTEHLRVRLLKWCATAVEKVTEDMEGLEMHTAVRNVMRLFDRIKDFEKRVLERDGELNRDNRTALLLALRIHAQMLAPFAPHIAEELWLELGGEDTGVQLPWPGVSFRVAA